MSDIVSVVLELKSMAGGGIQDAVATVSLTFEQGYGNFAQPLPVDTSLLQQGITGQDASLLTEFMFELTDLIDALRSIEPGVNSLPNVLKNLPPYMDALQGALNILQSGIKDLYYVLNDLAPAIRELPTALRDLHTSLNTLPRTLKAAGQSNKEPEKGILHVLKEFTDKVETVKKAVDALKDAYHMGKDGIGILKKGYGFLTGASGGEMTSVVAGEEAIAGTGVLEGVAAAEGFEALAAIPWGPIAAGVILVGGAFYLLKKHADELKDIKEKADVAIKQSLLPGDILIKPEPRPAPTAQDVRHGQAFFPTFRFTPQWYGEFDPTEAPFTKEEQRKIDSAYNTPLQYGIVKKKTNSFNRDAMIKQIYYERELAHLQPLVINMPREQPIKKPDENNNDKKLRENTNAIINGGNRILNINMNAPMYKVDHQVFERGEDAVKDFEPKMKEALLRILYSVPAI